METLVELLEEAARRFQHRDAFLFKPGFRTQRWSYGQLWEQTGKVASILEQRGITKGDRVVIWAPNRPEWAFAIFGCFRLGAVAVPLDVRSGSDFVQDVVAQTEPKLVFLSRFLPSSDAVGGVPSVYLE